ncbi:hypothetical protein [Thiohalobacter thiocyanaticus]|uniref:Uncharacterized protein n=1 Tax=Thiohalobacter thiocyanaticus TaxID=585455 RepID=A0A426QJH5_9GAMM|nr:hypothetical protein [Thiohalobacter thiocyanaticus]RRQ21913.1 hypothetical protein D6C00_08105 [Thiohalobacter thiocyanaticus]
MARLSDQIKRNEKNRCTFRGCDSLRSGISKYCEHHKQTKVYHGEPQGRTIRPWEYKDELAEVVAFTEKHADHRGLRNATKALDYIINRAGPEGSISNPAMIREMDRLSSHGVDALRALQEAAAVRLFFRRRNQLLSENRQLTFALGKAVLSLAPRDRVGVKGYRRIPPKPRKLLGLYLRDDLGGVVNGIVQGIETENQQREDFKKSLYDPFIPADREAEDAAHALPLVGNELDL